MNYIDRLTDQDGSRRTSQTRKVAVHSLHVDLPSDLATPIHLAARKAGVTPEALILDVLRDIFEPLLPAQTSLILPARSADLTQQQTERAVSQRVGVEARR